MQTFMRTSALLGIAAVSGPVLAGGAADFDAETEGFLGSSFTSGGITFFDINTNSGLNPDGSTFGPGDYGTDFIIERAVALANDFGAVSSPNVLGFGRALVPGDNLSINLVTDFSMTTGSIENAASLDLFHFEGGPWEGIIVRLEASLGGSVVASDSYEILGNGGGRDYVKHTPLQVDGADFDTLTLYATFADGTNTVIAGVVDNVVITPSPAGLGVLLLGGVMAGRRRR